MAASKNIYKIIILAFIFVIAISIELSGYQQIDYPKQEIDTVDFGLAYYVKDTLRVGLNVHNTSGKQLRIYRQAPSWVIGNWDYDGLGNIEQLDYASEPSNPNFQINNNSLDTIILEFSPDKDRNLDQTWKKYHTIIEVGFYDQSLYPNDEDYPTDTKDYVYYRQYKCISRKTQRYIDGYEQVHNFDSVYVDPLFPTEFKWYVKNVSQDTLEVYEEELITLPPMASRIEFTKDGVEIPRVFYPGEIQQCLMKYSPAEMSIIDSARSKYTLRYYPVKDRKDTTDEFTLNMTGIGVKQLLEIQKVTSVEATPTFKADTIDIGYIRVNDAAAIRVDLRNTGNIPYGALDHSFQKSKSSADVELKLLRSLGTNGHIYAEHQDTLEFSVSAKEKGAFSYTLKIFNDINSRGFLGVPPGPDTTRFVIRGIAVVPQIGLLKDTVDFGNIYLNCPQSVDTLFYIANSGNTELEIIDIKIEPLATVFSVSRDNFTIPAKSKDFVTINLTWIDSNDNFVSEMLIISNAEPPNDTLRVHLTATPTDPIRMIPEIPEDLKSRPGTRIHVPILVDAETITLSNSFIDTLYFDAALIRLASYELKNTASSGAIFDEIREISGGRIAIDLKMPSFFKSKDTLVKLYFNTYLGSKKSTEIVFSNPKFADNNCDNIFKTDQVNNGLYKTDSVCGLDYKIGLPSPRIISVYPNPSSDRISVEYFVPQDSIATFYLYNNMGTEIGLISRSDAKKGENKIEYIFNDLMPGVYYLSFQVGEFRKVVPVAITD
jgi:hypothetical protein